MLISAQAPGPAAGNTRPSSAPSAPPIINSGASTPPEGPEPTPRDWWRGGETMTRDYYRVEDSEGRRFWIYRRGLFGRETNEPAWYLHGLFA